jgi:hypothetical protein
MHFFFTSRVYDPATNTFTREIADTPSYVVLPHEGHNTGYRTNRDDWINTIRGDMEGGDVLVFVHGFNTTQDLMLRRLRKVKAALRANGYKGAVVAYSWPNHENWRKYHADKARVPLFARALYRDGIEPLMKAGLAQRMNLLCHSMGAYVFLMAMSGMTGPRRFDEIAFVAADLDRPWFAFGGQGDKLVRTWGRRFTNYYSIKDRVLDLAEGLVHGDPRVGGDGLPHPTGPDHQDIACAGRYLAPDHDGKRGLTYSHAFYFDDKPWLRDLSFTLAGKPGHLPTRGPAPLPPDHVLL